MLRVLTLEERIVLDAAGVADPNEVVEVEAVVEPVVVEPLADSPAEAADPAAPSHET